MTEHSLTVEQREREAVLYTALRMIIGNDVTTADVIDYAEYLRCGDRPPLLPPNYAHSMGLGASLE